VSVTVHWLTAALIIGLLAMGKYMTTLPDTESLRFDLTQWHKSFGLTVLMLSVFRVVWRLTHKPPTLPPTMASWEKFASGATHLLFYVLILFLPISGWLMVSASPLNISTLFFNVLPVPHLPIVSDAPNKAELAESFHSMHEYASGVLILLVLLHVGAALRHQFVLKDSVMSRITPDIGDEQFRDGTRLALGSLFVVLLGGWLLVTANNSAGYTSTESNREAGNWLPTDVHYTMIVMGDELQGSFAQAVVSADINPATPGTSRLQAIVETASGSTGSPQIDDALPGADWFNVAIFPQATFKSTRFETLTAEQMRVTGELTVRDISREISFTLELDEQSASASGGFAINRLDYDIGKEEQPDDSNAAFNVLIDFKFAL